MFKYLRLLLFLLFFTSFTYSNSYAKSKSKSKTPHNIQVELKSLDDFNVILDEISIVKQSDFILKIEHLKKRAKEYLYYLKGYCNGKFSSLVFVNSDDNKDQFKNNKESAIKRSLIEPGQKMKRLSRVEKKYCFSVFKKVQIKYYKTLFKSEEKYLKYANKIILKSVIKKNKSIIETLQEP